MADRPEIHLQTPPVEDPAAFRPILEVALRLTRPASLHLRVATADAQIAKRHVQALAAIVQDAGAALLIDPPVDLRDVSRCGADGVHVAGPAGLKVALADLKPDRIVGVGGLKSRDDAMTAGELGVDYVMFGEPRPDGTVPPLDLVVERCAWWAEVFNVPCIGHAPGPDAVPELARTGAEFLGFGPWAFLQPDDLKRALAALG